MNWAGFRDSGLKSDQFDPIFLYDYVESGCFLFPDTLMAAAASFFFGRK